MALAVLAGCGGQGQPVPASIPAFDSAGFAFAATSGAVIVSRPAAPLTYSDGLPAKRAAMAHCAAQGARLNPAALGRFSPAGWLFDGGCA